MRYRDRVPFSGKPRTVTGAGEAVILTSPAQRADDGTEIAIRY
jgi:hypothetical protein